MKRTYALVLTTPPHQPSLSQWVVSRASAAIPEGDRLGDEWLSPGEAWQLRFISAESTAGLNALRDTIRSALHGVTLDVNVVRDEIGKRRKMLLIADMDSTIIQQECIDEMADLFGLKAQISAITERSMRGELPFEAALTERLALLAGLQEADLQRVYDERITVTPGARTLVATMRAQGAKAALVSGGFTFFTSRVAQAVGFDEHQSNTLEIVDNKLTGRVLGPILGREGKRLALDRLSTGFGLGADQVAAVGDGANDLDMIRAAGLGIAYRAKPIVAAEAGASIVHGDLTALLFLQGYRRSEFVG